MDLPDTLDVDGDTYPSEERLRQIREATNDESNGRWLVETFPLLCEELAPYAYCNVTDGADNLGNPEKRIEFSTSGWSGCEDFINAVLGNMMIALMYHYSWRRGGHYEFRVPVSAVKP